MEQQLSHKQYLGWTRLQRWAACGAVLGTCLLAGPAMAAVQCGNVNINPVAPAGGAAATLMSSSFVTTTTNRRVDLKYSAECSIAGPTTSWLNIDIIVDPAGSPAPFICAPTSSDNALCSGNGTASPNDGWISAVTDCLSRIPTTGVHIVTVRANPVPAGTPWRIDDQSLACID